MTRERYSEKESMNRIVRIFEGKDPPSNDPETLSGEVLSENKALSDLVELLGGSLPNEAMAIPVALRDAIGNAGFFRGWGGGYNIFVDQNHANASDSNTGFNSNYPLSTITQAVTNARAMSGDTIFVLQNDGWIYGSGLGDNIVENVTIPATKPGLQLIGICPGAMGVNWSPTGTASFALTIYAIDTRVSGFNFWGDGDGIYAEWSDPLFGENCVIENNTFCEGINTAIQLEYVWYAKIRNNHFNEVDEYGILTSISGSGMAYAEIKDNWFHECGNAITSGSAMMIDQLEESLIDGNRIFRNDALTSGSAVNAGINTENGENNMISDNYFSCLLCNWDTMNTGNSDDAWINNHCQDGMTTSTPA